MSVCVILDSVQKLQRLTRTNSDWTMGSWRPENSLSETQE